MTIIREPSLEPSYNHIRLKFGKKNYVVICYVVVWQHVIGMVCVLFAVLSATESHSTQRNIFFLA